MRGQGTLVMGIIIVAVAAVLIYVIAVESPAAREVVRAVGAPVLSVINSTAVAYESPYQPQLVLCSWVNSSGVEGPLACRYRVGRLGDGEWAINLEAPSGKYSYLRVTVVSSTGAAASIELARTPNCTVVAAQYPRVAVIPPGSAYLGYSIVGLPNGLSNAAPINVTVTGVKVNGVFHPVTGNYLSGGQSPPASPAVASGVLNLNNLITGPGTYEVTLSLSTACRVINASTTFIILARLLNFYPFNVGCLGSLTQSGNNITRVLHAYTLQVSNGYELNAFLGNITVTTPGQLQVKLPTSPSSVTRGTIYAENSTAYISGTTYQPNKVTNLTLWSGNYSLNESLTFNAPITGRTVLLGSYAYNSQAGYINETILPVTANVMNLLNGVTKFYVKHVYQGDNQGNPTNQWPYLSLKGGYWSPSNIKQPILDLVPIEVKNKAITLSAGAMFWSEQYSGGNVTVRLIGTISGGTTPPGDGFDIYLFINSYSWSISSNYNYSIPYVASDFNQGPNGVSNFSPVQGDVILPYANPYIILYNYVLHNGSPYIMVQWNSFWQTGYTTSGATGQFNIWVISYLYVINNLDLYISVAPNPSPDLGSPYAGWDGVGSGYFAPHLGDYVCVTVKYVSSTNTLYASAVDLNTGQVATAQVSLGNYFSPPPPGNYVFGIGGSTASVDYADWGVVLANYTNG